MIIRGKDKGETGNIKRVIRTQNRVIVEGKNLVSDKHGTHYHSLGILFYCSKVQYSMSYCPNVSFDHLYIYNETNSLWGANYKLE